MKENDANRIQELEAELANLKASTLSEAESGSAASEQIPEVKGGVNPPVRRWKIVAGVATVIVLIVAAAVMTFRANSSNPDVETLETAYTACAENSPGITLKDDGRTLIFDHKGEEDISGADIEDIACILLQLDIPDSIVSHMDQTTSLDGRQVEEWDNFQIQWSYHPKRGMDGLVTVVGE